MKILERNIALIVGIAIPVLMVLIIAGVVYVPRWFHFTPPPQRDFIYAVGGEVMYPSYPGMYAPPYPAGVSRGVWPQYVYQVVGGKLTRRDAGTPPPEYGKMTVTETEPLFYVHHVATNKSEQVLFADAEKFTLDPSMKSPDGFVIERGGSGDGGMFPFFYDGNRGYNAQYIRKDYFSEKLDLNLPSNDYGEFFLAWVIK